MKNNDSLFSFNCLACLAFLSSKKTDLFNVAIIVRTYIARKVSFQTAKLTRKMSLTRRKCKNIIAKNTDVVQQQQMVPIECHKF